jgi:iron complex transport system ATP-binding protein
LMADEAVAIEGVEVVAGGRVILSLPHFVVPAGAVIGIVGPNGAGKTTLLKLCMGFVRPRTGQARVLGRPVAGGSRTDLVKLRRRLGYVPQHLPAAGEMPLTIREVVVIGRTGVAGLFRPLSRADWETVDSWIDQLGLARVAGQRYADASGGEQRKALIARAMVQQPEILMLDEPTANLDLGWREHMVATMNELFTSAGRTILLVCHEPEVLPPCCRQVVFLDAGRVIASGTPEEVLTTDRVGRLYGESLAMLHGSGRHAVIPRGVGTSDD